MKHLVAAENLAIAYPGGHIAQFDGFRESDPERRILSTEKIRTKTRWIPKISLDEGLDECIENYTK